MLRKLVSTRLVLVILGAALLAGGAFWAGRATAAGSPATGGQPSLALGAPTATGTTATGTTAQARHPVWCCSGNPLGLTATGQATVHGAGQVARSKAITQAMTDAASQAHAVTGAAGITLGNIINVQVSASYYSYPLPAAGAPGASRAAQNSPAPAGTPAGSGGSGAPTGSSVACPVNGPCGYPLETSVTVTVTWSLG